MKSKDIQKVVKTKYGSGDGPTKFFRELAEAVSLPTIKLWIKMINTTGSITLSSPPGCPYKYRYCEDMKISRTSLQRILRKDLGCMPYKKTKQPKLTNLQKARTIKFANWVLNNYRKDGIKKWLFTDERFFSLDGIYNSQNDLVWAVSREEADRKGGFHEKTKYPGKVMVWLGACAEGLTTSVILENGTMDAEVHINEVLPIALECGDRMLGSDWSYQQDGARPHPHRLTQE
ncbi:unnamed protein product [Rotaria magnacalcarata]|uniref:Transposase n=2 Tax=Rotaria magnacalcarata TaxID=392030 RepID=A0A819PAW4_9BILA|nr:unnamed protein product [Rotaria magnacalcarata]CAF4010911.1 unnamed protein product [Rotaria magnacalcarata]